MQDVGYGNFQNLLQELLCYFNELLRNATMKYLSEGCTNEFGRTYLILSSDFDKIVM